jgi:NADH:ubiquinone oxidoreductase subunit H
MPLILSFLLRAVLLAAGLVLAASLAVVFMLLVALWSLRALWARVTGRPAAPFVVRFGPRQAFDEMMRRAGAGAESRTPRADAASGARTRLADVSDVEPREPTRP